MLAATYEFTSVNDFGDNYWNTGWRKHKLTVEYHIKR